MAQKTYQQIQAEADRLFGKGASDAKFEWRRQQQAAEGLALEEKTRGGVAGAYDRNKALVQAALPTLAGILVPGAGALAGGVVGGLAKGLDRPGQGGVGLDVGQAARGALAGAGLGATGAAARTGLEGIFAPKAEPPKPTMAPTGPPAPRMTDTFNIGPNQMRSSVTGVPVEAQAALPRAPLSQAPVAATPVAPSVPRGGMGPIASVPTTARVALPAVTSPPPQDKPSILSDIVTGARTAVRTKLPEIAYGIGTGLMESQQARQQARLQERRIALEEQQLRQQEESRQRLAQLLMPLFQQQVTQYGQRQGA